MSGRRKEDFADPGGSQPLAFEAEIGDFVEGVEDSQVAVEFKAVDEDGLRQEADMLGS